MGQKHWIQYIPQGLQEQYHSLQKTNEELKMMTCQQIEAKPLINFHFILFSTTFYLKKLFLPIVKFIDNSVEI